MFSLPLEMRGDFKNVIRMDSFIFFKGTFHQGWQRHSQILFKWVVNSKCYDVSYHCYTPNIFCKENAEWKNELKFETWQGNKFFRRRMQFTCVSLDQQSDSAYLNSLKKRTNDIWRFVAYTFRYNWEYILTSFLKVSAQKWMRCLP